MQENKNWLWFIYFSMAILGFFCVVGGFFQYKSYQKNKKIQKKNKALLDNQIKEMEQLYEKQKEVFTENRLDLCKPFGFSAMSFSEKGYVCSNDRADTERSLLFLLLSETNLSDFERRVFEFKF